VTDKNLSERQKRTGLQAVILAAGMGKRLGFMTKNPPKGLVEIGEKSLLEYSLGALKGNGIVDVVIVIGFSGESIRRKFGTEYQGLQISYVVNEQYSKTGSMYSFSKAKEHIDGDIILLESDLLYDPEAVKITLDSDYTDSILVTELSGSGDEVYICTDNNQRIIDLGKNIADENKKKAIGELVGISRFSRAFLDELFKKAQEDYKKGELTYHYEECVFATSKFGSPVYAVLCEDLVWCEIDNKHHLKRAREEIYPRIKEKLNRNDEDEYS